MNKERIIREMNLKPFGGKGWYRNKNLVCPICGRSEKFGIKPSEKSIGIHCFYECQLPSYWEWMKSIGYEDLLDDSYEVSIKKDRLISIVEKREEKALKEEKLVKIKLPVLSKRIKDNEYLNERGFLKEHYEIFKPCINNIKLKDSLIFQIFQKGILYGYLARSVRSKEWHKENLRRSKEGLESLVLRYRNSVGTYFECLLGGYDQITEKTKKIIVVEGLFDKVGVDGKLNLFQDEEIRCVFTFGDSISEEQIRLIAEFKNIDEVILLYDNNTTKESKKAALQISKKVNTTVAKIKSENDPGSISQEELIEVLDKRVDSFLFFLKNI